MTNLPPDLRSGPEAPAPDTLPEVAPLRTSEMYDQSWLGSMLRPLLIVIMIGSFAFVLITLLARFAGDLPSGFFAGLALLAVVATIVGSVTTTVLAQPSRRAYRSPGYRAAEVGLFLAATRLYVWIASGELPSLGRMLERPLDNLFDMLFVAAAITVGLAWFFAVEMTGDFNQLALGADEFLHGKPRHGLANESVRAGGIDRGAVLSDFTIRWVTLGLVLIVLAAVLRRGISFSGLFGILRQDVEPTVLVPIVIYFVAGLLLLSHGRLAQLRSRWTMEQTPAQPDVTRRWPWEVIALVGGMALLALLLPLGGTFLLATILSTIINVLVVLVLLAYRLAGMAIFWFFSLFAGDATPPPQQVLPPTQTTPMPPVAQYHAALPPWAGGAFFWSAMVLLVAYAVFVYLRDRGVRFAWLDWLWLALTRRWTGVRAALKRTQLRLNLSRTSAIDATARPSLFAWGRRTWSNPEQQVRHLYLSTLRNAGEVGFPRRPSETPYEYAPRLVKSLVPQGLVPQSIDDGQDAADGTPAEVESMPGGTEMAAAMDALTDAFVELRYAGNRVDPGEVTRLQHLWDRLHDALRRHAHR